MNQIQQISPLALYDAQNNINQLQNKQQAAQNMTQTSGWGGGAGILGAALGGLLSGKYGNEASEAQNQYMKDSFMYEQEQARMAEQNKAIAMEAKRKQELTDEQLKYDREQQGRMDIAKYKTDNAKSDVINNNMPSQGEVQSEFQKKLAGNNAAKYNEWENTAIGANETLATLGKLQELSQLQATGKSAEVLAYASQWLGGDAGSNMQTFQAYQKKMMLDAAAGLKGAMSDGEWSVLQAQMPDFGNNPQANAAIMKTLSEASNRAISRYQGASDYVNENGKLQGYKPLFEFSKRKQAPQSEQSSQTPNYNDGQVIRNPTTGETMVMKGGQWVAQ